MDVDEPLLLFRAQYLQCIDHDFLSWPPPALLRQPDAQSFMFRRLFDTSARSHGPSTSYETQVLTTLLVKIRQASGNNTADSDIYTKLQARLSYLSDNAGETTSTSTWEQDTHVTYNCALTLATWRPIVLHESRSLISGSRHTGHRTWQGALHLATYLLANPRLVSGRRVLELGAGTGFLSILSRMFLGASCVTATDGEDRVVEAMRENLALNSLGGDDQIAACRLWWGSELEGDWRSRGAAKDIDVVLGADIIYQKEAARALVRTLRAFLDLQPRASILLSNALRFPDVFEVFRHDCEHNSLSIHVVEHQMTPSFKQKSLFYSTVMPLQIVEIKDSR